MPSFSAKEIQALRNGFLEYLFPLLDLLAREWESVTDPSVNEELLKRVNWGGRQSKYKTTQFVRQMKSFALDTQQRVVVEKLEEMWRGGGLSEELLVKLQGLIQSNKDTSKSKGDQEEEADGEGEGEGERDGEGDGEQEPDGDGVGEPHGDDEQDRHGEQDGDGEGQQEGEPKKGGDKGAGVDDKKVREEVTSLFSSAYSAGLKKVLSILNDHVVSPASSPSVPSSPLLQMPPSSTPQTQMPNLAKLFLINERKNLITLEKENIADRDEKVVLAVVEETHQQEFEFLFDSLTDLFKMMSFIREKDIDIVSNADFRKVLLCLSILLSLSPL